MKTETRYEILQKAFSVLEVQLYLVIANLPDAIGGPSLVEPLLLVTRKPGGASGFELEKKLSDNIKNNFLFRIGPASEEDVIDELWNSLISGERNIVFSRYDWVTGINSTEIYRFNVNGKNFEEVED